MSRSSPARAAAPSSPRRLRSPALRHETQDDNPAILSGGPVHTEGRGAVVPARPVARPRPRCRVRLSSPFRTLAPRAADSRSRCPHWLRPTGSTAGVGPLLSASGSGRTEARSSATVRPICAIRTTEAVDPSLTVVAAAAAVDDQGSANQRIRAMRKYAVGPVCVRSLRPRALSVPAERCAARGP